MADFTQMFLQGLQAGQSQKEAMLKHQKEQEDRDLQRQMLKHQMDRLKIEDQIKAREMAVREAQIPQLGATPPPIPIPDMRGTGSMPAPAELPPAMERTVPLPAVEGMAPAGQMVVPTIQGAEQVKRQSVFADALARETAQRQVAQQFPDLYTVPPAEAQLRGMPEYAGKQIPKDQWKSITDAQADFVREKKADERTNRALGAEAVRENRRSKEESRRVFNSIQAQWYAAPGVADAVKGDLANKVFDEIGAVYMDRLKKGKPLGEAEEQLLVQRLRNLEPTSVVMPSEFARASGMSPLYQRIGNLIPRLTVRGGKVPPELVKQALETAAEIHTGRREWLAAQARPFVIRATEAGIPIERFTFAPYAGSGDKTAEDIFAKYDGKKP